jgi:uncharacterized protein YsxB (DUF464 family)
VIRVSVRVGPDGLLRELSASGHARKTGDASLVCASASLLVRTAAEAIKARLLGRVTVQADREGELKIGPIRPRLYDRGWLRGATQVLLTGLRDLARETDEVELIMIE